MITDFRTIVDPGKFGVSIDVGSRLFLAGSCFSDNMGEKFHEHRLQAMVNPFGVLYNPFSMARVLQRMIDGQFCTEDELVPYNGLWHHFDFHGRFSHVGKKSVVREINRTLDEATAFLRDADFLVLTFGTAWVYENIESGRIVANCHKMPGHYFHRYRLETDEITALYKDLIVALRIFNPSLKILFTVSPVRHWKDGAHANQLSKSVLLLAIDKLCEWFEKVEYFPAYEIMMDELRDYRFYDDRMFNPSGLAVNHIWEKLVSGLLTSRARQFVGQAVQINKARNHRPSGNDDESYYRFLQNSLNLVRDIQSKFPEAHLDADYRYFDDLLKDQERG